MILTLEPELLTGLVQNPQHEYENVTQLHIHLSITVICACNCDVAIGIMLHCYKHPVENSCIHILLYMHPAIYHSG